LTDLVPELVFFGEEPVKAWIGLRARLSTDRYEVAAMYVGDAKGVDGVGVGCVRHDLTHIFT
jgi:hypothetical protein